MKIRKILSCVVLLLTAFTMTQTIYSQNRGNHNFELPAVPDSLVQPQDRAQYIIAHYWDNFDFATDYSGDTSFVEQTLVDFLSVLPYVDSNEYISEAFDIILSRSAHNEELRNMLNHLIEAYLGNSDSPMKNDRVYVDYLSVLISRPELDEIEKMRKEDLIEMLNKNRVGTVATNFTFTTLNNKTHSMSDILSPQSDLILMFFDPNCDVCEEEITQMVNSEYLKNRIENGELKILAVYSGDNFSAWQRKAETMPGSWIVGISESEIEDNDLYYLPSLPTFYLIGPDGVIKAKELPLSWMLGEF